MNHALNIAMSFRSLANVEQAFIYYLNCTRKKTFEFYRLRTCDFAFAYGMSEEEYEWELNTFITHHLERVEPVAGAEEAVSALRDCFPTLTIITTLDKIHHSGICTWLWKHFAGWRPRVLHAVKQSHLEEYDYILPIDELCASSDLGVFITENPITAQRVTRYTYETEVLLLRQPWNEDMDPIGVLPQTDWGSVVTEIFILARQ